MDLDRYRGRNVDVSDLPEIVQDAFCASIRRTVAYYGEDTVDAQMTHDQIRLCDATAEYIYGEYTPPAIQYERGSRPELERFVTETLDDVAGERERVLGILRFVRDIPTRRPGGRKKGTGDLFHGGTEEEIIKKCTGMCNEQARAFCVLCQVAGIPARYVGHYVGGHGVDEAFVDGHWAYFDIRGKYFVKSDGCLASTLDLIHDPGIIDRQPPEVTVDILKGYDLNSTRRYFAPVEVTVVTNYFAWDRDRYDFDWIWNTAEFQARVAETRGEFPEELNAENTLAMVRGERPWPK